MKVRLINGEESAMRLIAVLLAGLLVLGGATQAAAQMPTPVLTFDGAEYYQAGGKTWVRYKLRVVNWAGYADALFDPAPASLVRGGERQEAA
jgi:hypothetical protein